jgi:dCTP deaminase
MILCDREVEYALNQKRLFIDPRPDRALMDSTAIDLRLGACLDRWVFPESDSSLGHEPPRFRPGLPNFKFADLEKKYTASTDISSVGYDLPPKAPQNFVLGWTLEKIYIPHTSRLCARVEGKSSLGRMGLGVHITAPTIHAGFGHNKNNSDDHGAQLRLEIWNVGPIPIELVMGMRICQLIVEEVREVPSAGYSGQFNIQGPDPKS